MTNPESSQPKTAAESPRDGISDEEFRELVRESGTPVEKFMISRIIRQRKQITDLEHRLATAKQALEEIDALESSYVSDEGTALHVAGRIARAALRSLDAKAEERNDG
jgi:cob(I)alamin adenosyltransferase